MQAGGRVIAWAMALPASLTGRCATKFANSDSWFATAGERVVLAAADDFGPVNLDQAGEHAAVGRHHAAAQLAAINQADLYEPKASWRCSCSAENAVEWVAIR